MFKSLAIILLVAALSIYNSDLNSESAVLSLLLPILSVISLVALALWLVAFFHRRGINQKTGPGGGGMDFNDGGGGDGG